MDNPTKKALEIIAKEAKIKDVADKLVQASRLGTLEEAVILLPLLPFREKMIDTLNYHGDPTPRTISHLDLCTKYFNKFCAENKPLASNWYESTDSFNGMDSFSLKKGVLKKLANKTGNTIRNVAVVGGSAVGGGIKGFVVSGGNPIAGIAGLANGTKKGISINKDITTIKKSLTTSNKIANPELTALQKVAVASGDKNTLRQIVQPLKSETPKPVIDLTKSANGTKNTLPIILIGGAIGIYLLSR